MRNQDCWNWMPPADRHAGRLDPHQRAGQEQERNHDAGGGGQEAEADRAPLAAAVADDAQKLDREDGKHAGHEVEDQPAEHRQDQDERQR